MDALLWLGFAGFHEGVGRSLDGALASSAGRNTKQRFQPLCGKSKRGHRQRLEASSCQQETFPFWYV